MADLPYPAMFWELNGNADTDSRFVSGDLNEAGTGDHWAVSGFWNGDGSSRFLHEDWSDNEANFDSVFKINEGAFLLAVRVAFVNGQNASDATIFKAGVNNANQGVELFWDVSNNAFRCRSADDSGNLKLKVTVNTFTASEDGNTYNIFVWVDNRFGAKSQLIFDNRQGADPEPNEMNFLGEFSDITGGTDGAQVEDRQITIGARSISNNGTIGNYYAGSIQRIWAVNFGPNVPSHMNQFLVNLNNNNLSSAEWWNV